MGDDPLDREQSEQPETNPSTNQSVNEEPVIVEPETPQQPTEPSAPITPVTDVKPPKKSRLVFYIVIGVLVLLGVAFFIFRNQVLGMFIKQPVADQTAQTSNKTSSEETKVTDPALIKFITPTTGETWYVTPKEMDNQGLLNEDYRDYYISSSMTTVQIDEQYSEGKPTYYEVGTHGNKAIVMARRHGQADYATFFEKAADGSFSIIAEPSSTATYDQHYLPSLKDELKTTKVVTVDETTHYDSLSLPDTIMLKNGEMVTNLKYPSFLFSSRAEGMTETSVMQLGAATLYRTEKAYADTKLTNIGYTVKLSFGPEIKVDYIPNTRSLEKYMFDNSKAATYKDYQGNTIYDEINAIAQGCGGTSAAVTRADSLQDSDLVAVGKTDTGRVVYGLKDTSSALMTKAYGEYKEAYPDNPVSLSDYVANHGLMIIKNASGERFVYVRGQYGMNGGCAKPVVYLYPQMTMSVNVRVGANVTVSDPQYTTSGWQNVVARPDGQLAYGGTTYDLLFWEGTGYGEYPGITSGTVVKRADAAATIRRQLAQQGLNAKETADFMAFWEGKIPNKPYIRLTWLNTADMNALAPLSISPKPDTVIRVFLDMEGFDRPILLPAQVLTSVQRSGFTVVEWGGLTPEIRH